MSFYNIPRKPWR